MKSIKVILSIAAVFVLSSGSLAWADASDVATVPGCDFNGDGVDEYVVAGPSNFVYSDETTSQSVEVKINAAAFSNFSCKDIDGNGSSELIAESAVGKTSVTKAWDVEGNAVINSKVAIKALSSVCRTVKVLSSPVLWKTQASAHLPRTDPRKYSTTLIWGRGARGVPSSRCLNVYAANGQLVHKVGLYRRGEREYAARFYGGWGCGDKKNRSCRI